MVNEQKEETTAGVDTQNGNGETVKSEELPKNGDAAVKNGEPVKNGEAAKNGNTGLPPKRPEEPENTYTNLEVFVFNIFRCIASSVCLPQ